MELCAVIIVLHILSVCVCVCSCALNFICGDTFRGNFHRTLPFALPTHFCWLRILKNTATFHHLENEPLRNHCRRLGKVLAKPCIFRDFRTIESPESYREPCWFLLSRIVRSTLALIVSHTHRASVRRVPCGMFARRLFLRWLNIRFGSFLKCARCQWKR